MPGVALESIPESCTSRSGPPSRKTANILRPALLQYYCTWPFYGPNTSCGTGHFWPAWYFQMRRPAVTSVTQSSCCTHSCHRPEIYSPRTIFGVWTVRMMYGEARLATMK